MNDSERKRPRYPTVAIVTNSTYTHIGLTHKPHTLILVLILILWIFQQIVCFKHFLLCPCNKCSAVQFSSEKKSTRWRHLSWQVLMHTLDSNLSWCLLHRRSDKIFWMFRTQSQSAYCLSVCISEHNQHTHRYMYCTFFPSFFLIYNTFFRSLTCCLLPQGWTDVSHTHTHTYTHTRRLNTCP